MVLQFLPRSEPFIALLAAKLADVGVRVFVAPEQGLAAEHLAARGTRILSISVLGVYMILKLAGVRI